MNISTVLLISISYFGLSSLASAAYSVPNAPQNNLSSEFSASATTLLSANGLSAHLGLPLKGESLARHANVCFITDTEDCRGYEFSGANSPDDTSPGGGTPDDWELDNDNRCVLEGYTLHATLLPQLTSSIQFVPL